MSDRSPQIKEVIVRKLGREKAYGLSYKGFGEIHIHSDIKSGKEELETWLHEMLHIINPNFSEKRVTNDAKKMTNILWKQGYRKCRVK